MWLENNNAEYQNMMKIWEKLESKSSYHFPNSWWVRGGILLNTCHLKKLWRGQENQRKPRTSELSDSETLKQFNPKSFEYVSISIFQAAAVCGTPVQISLHWWTNILEEHQTDFWKQSFESRRTIMGGTEFLIIFIFINCLH